MPQPRKPRTPAQQARAEARRTKRLAEREQAATAEPAPIGPDTAFTVTLTGEKLAFLRLLLSNANVQPARLKVICGETQEQIEALIGPLPQGQ